MASLSALAVRIMGHSARRRAVAFVVLLGAEVLFGNILRLGAPGLFVAWLVTPVVIVFMYQFGVRFLRIGSRSLVMVIAAATSVCGVSAAIAVAAAARARKQELTLAVGMSLIFTVAMMIVMPLGTACRSSSSASSPRRSSSRSC